MEVPMPEEQIDDAMDTGGQDTDEEPHSYAAEPMDSRTQRDAQTTDSAIQPPQMPLCHRQNSTKSSRTFIYRI